MGFTSVLRVSLKTQKKFYPFLKIQEKKRSLTTKTLLQRSARTNYSIKEKHQENWKIG